MGLSFHSGSTNAANDVRAKLDGALVMYKGQWYAAVTQGSRWTTTTPKSPVKCNLFDVKALNKMMSGDFSDKVKPLIEDVDYTSNDFIYRQQKRAGFINNYKFKGQRTAAFVIRSGNSTSGASYHPGLYTIEPLVAGSQSCGCSLLDLHEALTATYPTWQHACALVQRGEVASCAISRSFAMKKTGVFFGLYYKKQMIASKKFKDDPGVPFELGAGETTGSVFRRLLEKEKVTNALK